MVYKVENPFDSIEDAHQYVSLLSEALEQTQGTIQEDIAIARADGAGRRREALLLVDYKLERLRHHVDASRHILNDLRTLRRLLLGEREGAAIPRAAARPVLRSPAPADDRA